MKHYRVFYMILGQRHQHLGSITSYQHALDVAADYRARKFWAFVEKIK